MGLLICESKFLLFIFRCQYGKPQNCFFFKSLIYDFFCCCYSSQREMQETRVRSLGWEDPLEEKMATHWSILAWEILWTEEPDGLQSMGSALTSEPPGKPNLEK